jgi:hypothetical protein
LLIKMGAWIDRCRRPLRILLSNRTRPEFEAKKRSAGDAPARYATQEERRDMTIDIEIQRLVNFETATDGTAVKLIVADIANREIGIILKIETLTALLMTLPEMASSAVKRAHNDPSMRITYPLREFEIEFGPDNLRILTIGTPDGFEVSFSLTEDLSLELGQAHLDGAGQRAKTH